MAEGGGLSAGTVSLPVKPDTSGFAKILGAGVLGATSEVSKKASEAFAKTFGATTAVKLKEQNKVILASAADVERASMKVRTAQEAEVASAGRLRIADAQLAEARIKYAEGDSRLLKAEERLAVAQKTHAANSATVEAATARLVPVQGRLTEEQGKLTTMTERSHTALGRLGTGFRAVGSGVASMAGPLAIAGGVAAALGVEAVKAAANFETATTRLVTDAGESEKNLSKVRDGILNISASTGTGATDIAKGMYLIESAGYHGAAGLKVMKAAAEGAKIGGADLTSVSDALTTVMTDYGIRAGKAADTTSKLIATVSTGKTTMEALAGSLHSVIPAAEAAHISLAQVLGAVGTMTAEGISADQATQNLNHAILSLQNPTAVQTKAMAAMGLSSLDVAKHLGQRGLTGTLDLLQKSIMHNMGPAGLVLEKTFNQSKQAAQSAQIMLKALPQSLQATGKAYLDNRITQKEWTKTISEQPALVRAQASQFATVAKNAHGFSDALKTSNGPARTFTAELARMTGGQVGLQVALHLSGIHASTFAANVKSIGGASAAAGGHVRDWATIQKTFNQQMSEAGAAFDKAGIKIGTALMPAVMKLLPDLVKVADDIGKMGPIFSVLGGVIGWVIDVAIKPLTGTLSGLGQMMDGLKHPATLMGDALHGKFGFVADSVIKMGTVVGTAIGHVRVFFTGMVKNLQAVGKQIGDAFTGIRNWFTGVGKTVAHGWQTITGVFTTAIDRVKKVLQTGFLIAFGLVVLAWNKIVQIFGPTWNKITKIVGDGIHKVLSFVEGPLKVLAGIWNKTWGAISSFVAEIWQKITGSVSSGTGKSTSVITGALTSISGLWNKVWNSIVSFLAPVWNKIVSAVSAGVSKVVGFVAGIGGKVLGAVAGFGTLLFSAGQNLIQGLINGVTGMLGHVVSSIGGIASSAISAAKKALGIRSPSTVFHTIGTNIAQGLINGLLGSKTQVVSASDQLANVVIGMFAQKKGGISHATESGALHLLGVDTKKLVALSNKRAGILARITKEKAAVSAAQSIRTSDISNTESATTGLFSVTNYTSGASMVAGLQQIIASTKKFKDVLAKLVKAGIDPVTYRQIVEAGVGGGGLVAAELLLQQPKTIKQIASLQGQLGTQAKALGTTTADHLYSAGVSSAKGLLKGLQSQSSALTKQMEHLASSMVHALKKKLGIHSPSTVFTEHGLNIAAGLSNGIKAGTKDVHDAIRKMTDKPVAMSSTLRMSQEPGAIAAPVVYMPDTITVQDAQGFEMKMRVVAEKTYRTQGQYATARTAGGSR